MNALAQNVVQRREAELTIKTLASGVGDKSLHFWRCLAEAAMQRATGAMPVPKAKPSLVVDVVELLRSFSEPGLELRLAFMAELDSVLCEASLRHERAKHSLQLSVLEQAADADAHVAELLRRLARMVVRSADRGSTV